MPVLPHIRSIISIGPATVTGDDPTVREVLGSRHRAGSAVKAGRRVVADTNIVGRPRTGVVTVGVGLLAQWSTLIGPDSRSFSDWWILTLLEPRSMQ